MLITVLAVACGSGEIAGGRDSCNREDSAAVARALDSIERESFYDQTATVGDHRRMEIVIGGTAEVRFLVAHAELACGMILSRIDRFRTYDPPLVTYFITIRECRCREGVDAIVRYLKRLGDSTSEEPQELLSPWHPYIHALRALEALTGGAVPAGDIGTAPERREELIHHALEWLREQGEG